MMRTLLIMLFLCAAVRCFSQEKHYEIEEEPGFVCLVPVMPEYPGGDSALRSYLKANIRYPDAAIAKGITGTVYIEFIIDSTGKVTNAKAARGLADCDECNERALEAIRKMPLWKPGYSEGKPVDVRYMIPVKFAPRLPK